MILDGLYILFAGFIGFGCGLVFAARMFRMTIESKANRLLKAVRVERRVRWLTD